MGRLDQVTDRGLGAEPQPGLGGAGVLGLSGRD